VGRIEDLEEAIVHYRQALNLHPPGHPHRQHLSTTSLAVLHIDLSAWES
jgi:hypothetical protein